MKTQKEITKFMKANHRNEQRKLWNYQLEQAGFLARYIVEAEDGVWIESEGGWVDLAETEEVAPEEVAPEEEIATEEIAEEIYNTVVAMDTELGTENFLPIYHVRNALSYNRKQFDTALYLLIRNDRLDVSTLQEANAYTPEQIDAGIPQAAGGALFFLEVI